MYKSGIYYFFHLLSLPTTSIDPSNHSPLVPLPPTQQHNAHVQLPHSQTPQNSPSTEDPHAREPESDKPLSIKEKVGKNSTERRAVVYHALMQGILRNKKQKHKHNQRTCFLSPAAVIRFFAVSKCAYAPCMYENNAGKKTKDM